MLSDVTAHVGATKAGEATASPPASQVQVRDTQKKDRVSLKRHKEI